MGLQKHVCEIAEKGYSVIEQVISPQKADAIAQDLARLEDVLAILPHDNAFEGSKTVRIYNLLAHGRLYEEIPVHERVLPVVEGVLDRECLVSSLSSISIAPGETRQPLHGDD
jgi:ectoine hydroxylase-related dioxygenase (phytanoyl-CoA dioxygenase family)